MQYMQILSALILLSCFALISKKHPKEYIEAFRMQSFIICIAAAISGVESLYKGEGWDIIIVCIIIVILKVFYIPRLLIKTFDKVNYKSEKSYFFSIPTNVIICIFIIIVTRYALSDVDGSVIENLRFYLVNSVSTILIGFFFMITRKKAIGQIVGFLIVENGLFVTAMLSTDGMPIVVDLGIFIDLVTAVLIMGVIVFRINESFDSTDTIKLRNLRG
jgi:hydrogenase-4 component E